MQEGRLHGPMYDMSSLGFAKGELVAVTGGASGIGRATALVAAKSGLKVAIWDLDSNGAAQTLEGVREFGAEGMALTVDVTDREAVEAAWEKTLAQGACRYLVNNAGPPSTAAGPFLDNLNRALGSVELVTSTWLARVGDRASSMVNLSSIAGNFQGGGQAISAFYPAAKTGIVGYTRYLATKYGGKPRANAVAPGVTITPRTAPMLDRPDIAERAAQIPQGRLGFPEEIASAIVFLLSPAASYVNGVLMPVDGAASLA